MLVLYYCACCYILQRQEKKNNLIIQFINLQQTYMKADSFQTKFLAQQIKNKIDPKNYYSSFNLGTSVFTSKMKSEESIDKKLSVSQPMSPSYLKAMRALQDRIRTLEGENGILNEQINISQNYCTTAHVKSKQRNKVEKLLSTMTKNDVFQKDKTDEKDQKIKELDKKLKQSEIENEDKIAYIHPDYKFQISQNESKIRELAEEINNIQQQLNLNLDTNESYKKKITQLNQQLQKEKQITLNYQLQLDTFVKSSKQWNESMSKMNQDIKLYKEQIQELQQYLDWYTTQYPVDKFQFMELEIKQLQTKNADLVNQLDQQRLQNSQLISDIQLLKLQYERIESQKHKQIEQLNAKIFELQLLVQRQESKDQQQQTSNKKQVKKFSITQVTQVPTSEQEQIKQTTDDDTSFVIVKKNNEDTQDYENISRQIIKLELMLEELDQKYDQIVKQAQIETDMRVKQTLRQELIQILAQIKDINQQINVLISQQKSLKTKL
ncbi:unnamed protein product (macronuclear) [Paramecium tetraurelia]|uniref:Uncharacterized protein n=1 Tax=Paramecium tetraurelia TaxID=5888 RepID=A0BCM2_PARTE|nr:uncharacterized protein GSPATT00004383001 [Paramecium tetraurelia]CAK56289.1 unnamed protein product [Paramecium tetraurelia]|eukprot:XP_001423687.1 hypothetical protein (macronuclear) [Paramecium tetraurelia strain d4-2]